MDRTPDKPIPLELPERLRQHLVRDAADPPMQLAVTLRPVGQLMQDQQRPFVADAAHDLLDVQDVGGQLFTCHRGGITPQGTYLHYSRSANSIRLCAMVA